MFLFGQYSSNKRRHYGKLEGLTKDPGYRFTKGLAQNLNLRTHLKLEYMESRSTPQTIVYRIKNKCRKLHNVQIKSKTLLQNTVSVKSSNSRI